MAMRIELEHYQGVVAKLHLDSHGVTKSTGLFTLFHEYGRIRCRCGIVLVQQPAENWQFKGDGSVLWDIETATIVEWP